MGSSASPSVDWPSIFTLKACFGAGGLAVGMVGIAAGRRWLVLLAVGLLGIAFLLRFAQKDNRAPQGRSRP
ncbi:MAG: hypothetical protein ACREMF_04675 [Gemmatimonadales bacterium]